MPPYSNSEPLQRLVRPHLRHLQTYEGVEPPEVLARRAGVPEDRIIKLNGNENPYGSSPRLGEALARRRSYHLYPDPQQRQVRQALAGYVGLGPEHIVAGGGADEVIDLLLRVVLNPGDRVVNCEPTFGMYTFSTTVLGGEVIPVPRDERFQVNEEGCLRAIDQGAKVVFICSPNNPTGNLCPRPTVERLLEREALVVVDETYHEFSGETLAPLVPRHWNLVVLRSLSKWAGLAGLRLGYGLMAPRLAEYLLATKPPYNLSTAAEAALLVSLEDRDLLMERVRAIAQERERLAAALGELPHLRVWPSRANFLLCQAPPRQGRRMVDGLAQRGIFVRYFHQPRLEDSFRVGVGLPAHTDALVSALAELL